MIDQDGVRIRWLFSKLETELPYNSSIYELSKLYMWEDLYDWRAEVDKAMKRDTV